MTAPIRAITLDLDDTLWPVWPAIRRAESAVLEWLALHAPATAARFDTAGLRRLRDEVAQERPEWGHDLSAIRVESLRRALLQCGEDVSLAAVAFEVFSVARNRVDLYPDALAALRRLAGRFPLLALSNGNADLARVGIAHFFHGSLSAREFGSAKPDPEIFLEACRRLLLPPQQVLHIGDDYALDVQGAIAAGMPAAWLRRTPQSDDGTVLDAAPPTYRTFSDLVQIADHLAC